MQHGKLVCFIAFICKSAAKTRLLNAWESYNPKVSNCPPDHDYASLQVKSKRIYHQPDAKPRYAMLRYAISRPNDCLSATV